MRRLLRWLLVVCLTLVIVTGGLLWRLSLGPLSLAPLQPLLETLIERGGPYLVTFTDPSLVWLRHEGTIALEIHDLEARTLQGAFVASAPLLRGTVAARPLLFGQIELVEAQLDLPEIELARTAEGRLVLSFGGKLADIVLGQAGNDEGLDTLLGGSGEITDPRIAQLRSVRVTAPSLQFTDTLSGDRATASEPVFELRRVNHVWTVSLAGKLGEGRVEATAEPAANGQDQQVTVRFQDLRAQDFAAFAPDLPLAGITVPISGNVGFTINPTTGARGPATVDLAAAAGEVGVPTLGLAPIPIKGGSLRGRLAPGWLQGEIERCEVATDGYSLTLAGTLGLVATGIDADLTLYAAELDVAEILQLWPGDVAAEARAWVVDNIPAGQVSAAKFQLASHSSRPNQPEIGGQLTFGGLQLRYLDTMPPATDLAGTASLAGNSLQVKVAAGRSGEVDLTRGEVVLGNLLVEQPSQLKLQANLRSTVPAAMRLLDAEPVALGKATGLSPADASGTQVTDLTLTLPLLDEIPPDKISFKAVSRLSDVQLRQASPGYDVAARRIDLVAEPAGVSGKGEIQVNGVSVTVDARENTPAVRGVQRTLKASGSIDAAGAKALAVEWPAEIGGAVGFDVTLTEARNPLRTVDVSLDLRRASFALPPLLLTKRPGEAGSASARLVQANPTSLAVQQAQVEVAGWRVAGDADLTLEPVQAQRIVLREARGPLGDLTADLSLDGSRWRGRVDIGRLDLRPAMQGGAGGGGDTVALPDFRLDLSARQLRLGDAPFSNLSGSIEHRRSIWASTRLRANIEDSNVSLDVATPAQRSIITLSGSDAGWLIRGLSASDNGIRGGTFRLSADINQAAAGGPIGGGELKIRDFTLWGAPLVARIVSLASFSGLSNALRGQGVPVQRLVVPFRLQGQRITLNEARMVGSDIGARADGSIDLGAQTLAINGTVAPAYTINRFLGRIPILGQIMSGGRSDAVLAATFSVSGPISQPQISVNPLAALVPGVIRDLFNALSADTEGASGGRLDDR